jgi:hypothetical protein
VSQSGFSDTSSVVVEEVDAKNWKVVRGFTYVGAKGIPFEVPPGSPTDFASVPRFFLWFLPSYGKYTKAAVLHDRLWRHYVPAGSLSYVDADGILRRAMRELGVPFLQRWIMWAAVRWGALLKPGGRQGWLGQAPRVLLVTAIALPVVGPPFVVISLAMVLWVAIESILWVPLKLGSLYRIKRNKPAKDVVSPKVTISV